MEPIIKPSGSRMRVHLSWFAVTGICLLVICCRQSDPSPKSPPQVPYNLAILESHYASWKSGEILERLPVTLFGDNMEMEIVFNDRVAVAGFIPLRNLSEQVTTLHAILHSNQIRIITYKDGLWIYVSKREYTRLHGPF